VLIGSLPESHASKMCKSPAMSHLALLLRGGTVLACAFQIGSESSLSTHNRRYGAAIATVLKTLNHSSASQPIFMRKQ
jgi:hypothetical protein